MSLRNYFHSIEPHFEKGGKYEKYYPIFEMVETIFFTSNTVTKVAPHARSFVDMKRGNDLRCHFYYTMCLMGTLQHWFAD